jgi:hypothetical protein
MADDPRTGKAAARALPFLEQGEQLRCAAEFHVAPGVPEPPFWMVREVYPQLAPATKAGTVMAAGGYAQDVLVGNVIGRGLHGRGMAGGWRSTAGRLRIHVVANAGDLVVTDRRVLVLQPRLALKGLKPTDEMVPCWETERAEITGVRPRPKGVLQRGRLDVHFRDGSWIGLVMRSPAHREPMAAALGGGAGEA